MKILILIVLVLVLGLGARAYVITNVDPSIVTNYSMLVSNINNNNDTFVKWLNAHENTNSYFFTSITNLNLLLGTLPSVAPRGMIYPSNAWNLATVTNAMTNFSFWLGNSNGQALVGVSLSNGVPRVKQLIP